MDGKKRLKKGVMGGTFNPIHMGHLMLAEWAMEEANLDEILFMPTGQSYMKHKQEIVSGKERIRMVELAIAGRERFSCSDIEVKRGGNTYTYETMEALHLKEPNTDYYFIMGADCLFTIEKWRCPERIFRSCKIIAAARNGASIERMEEKCHELIQCFGGEIQLLRFPAIELSSSDIRKRVAEKRSIHYMVPDNVIDYINKMHFYSHKKNNTLEDCQ